MRALAKRMGLHPDRWSQHVEVATGRETVRYVANIYKYYLSYKLMMALDGKHKLKTARHIAKPNPKRVEWAGRSHRKSAMHFTPRQVFLCGLLAALGMIAFAVGYFQIHLQLEPCPLCVLQRIGMFAVAGMFLLPVLHNPGPTGVRVYAVLGFLTAMAGAAVSVRHLWLQNLPPDQIPDCGPGYDYIMENFPLLDAIPMLLKGSGDCADVLWTFLGISIPGWTLIGFLFLGLLSLSQWWNPRR